MRELLVSISSNINSGEQDHLLHKLVPKVDLVSGVLFRIDTMRITVYVAKRQKFTMIDVLYRLAKLF